MGNFLKNTVLKAGSTGIQIPSGSTADRPTTAVNGQLRFNTDTGFFEFYQGSNWSNVTSRGAVTITKDIFTGDGVTTAFTLSATPAQTNGPVVYLGNVHQNAGVAYTIASSTMTFSVAPPNGQTIEVYHGYDSTDR